MRRITAGTRIGFVTLSLGVVLGATSALASSGTPSAPCPEPRIESHVAVSRARGGTDQDVRVDLTISVTVTNTCTRPIEVIPESFVSYTTSLVGAADDISMPGECASGRATLYGQVLPAEAREFVVATVRGCVADSRAESVTLTIEDGLLATNGLQSRIPPRASTLRVTPQTNDGGASD